MAKTGTEAVMAVKNLHDAVPEASPLPWYKQPNLRQLYLMMPFLFLGSTTLGYDGSLLNGLQTMASWQDCKYDLVSLR